MADNQLDILIRLISDTTGAKPTEEQVARIKEQFNALGAEASKAATTAGQTWREFVAENMAEAMKRLGSHGAAMRELGERWRELQKEAQTYGATVAATAKTAPPPATPPASPDLDGKGFGQRLLDQAGKIVAWTVVVHKAIGAITNWVGQYRQFVSAAAGADAALANSGQLTDANRDKVRRYAAELQRATGINDNEWLASQARLIKLGQVQMDQMGASLEVVKNLAGLIGGDLQQATMIYTRVLNGNLYGLARLGITVDQHATKMERMRQLQEQAARGAAFFQARMETLDGALMSLRNSVGDFGKALISAFEPVIRAAARFAEAVIPKAEISSGLTGLANSIGAVGKAAGDAAGDLENMGAAGESAADKATKKMDEFAAAIEEARDELNQLMDVQTVEAEANITAQEAAGTLTKDQADQARQQIRNQAELAKARNDVNAAEELAARRAKERSVAENTLWAARQEAAIAGAVERRAAESAGLSRTAPTDVGAAQNQINALRAAFRDFGDERYAAQKSGFDTDLFDRQLAVIDKQWRATEKLRDARIRLIGITGEQEKVEAVQAPIIERAKTDQAAAEFAADIARRKAGADRSQATAEEAITTKETAAKAAKEAAEARVTKAQARVVAVEGTPEETPARVAETQAREAALLVDRAAETSAEGRDKVDAQIGLLWANLASALADAAAKAAGELAEKQPVPDYLPNKSEIKRLAKEQAEARARAESLSGPGLRSAFGAAPPAEEPSPATPPPESRTGVPPVSAPPPAAPSVPPTPAVAAASPSSAPPSVSSVSSVVPAPAVSAPAPVVAAPTPIQIDVTPVQRAGADTAQEVQKFTAATLGAFEITRAALQAGREDLAALRRDIANIAARQAAARNP